MKKKQENKWMEKYNLAKVYFEHYGNLEVPSNFKTLNGYESDENGISLGYWIRTQREAYQGKVSCKMTEERIKLLEKIGMRFNNIDTMIEWKRKYDLAVAYYEHHGNLEVPQSFKTFNGYEHDKKGIRLGNWISAQRSAYHGKNECKLTEEQIDLLNKIGMRFGYLDMDNEWMGKYNLAAAYYEYYGNLEVPRRYKTLNGYEPDQRGMNLGNWVSNQRQGYHGENNCKMTEERIKLLEKIGMRFDSAKNNSPWMGKYNLAVAYYKHHGNLEVPRNFKTINGYEYNEDGIHLGDWISNQRRAYYGKNTCKLTEEQLNLLNQIEMRFVSTKDNSTWEDKYKLATAYYEHHGNLEVPQDFKTINGYEYDKEGIRLGNWISNQRQAYRNQNSWKLTEDKIALLEKIGMRFGYFKEKSHKTTKKQTKKRSDGRAKMMRWEDKYKLAVAYYEHYGNLDVPDEYKTSNGYDYDENGIKLGRWINNQRQAYRGKNTCKLTDEQINLLKQIGMRFDYIDRMSIWMEQYKLAKNYYEQNGNLDMAPRYKITKSSDSANVSEIKLGQWIYNQRRAYKGDTTRKLTEEQINLLEEIGIVWINDTEEVKYQTEEINEENLSRKKVELLNRVKSFLSNYDNQTLPQKELLNSNFLEDLDSKVLKKTKI